MVRYIFDSRHGGNQISSSLIVRSMESQHTWMREEINEFRKKQRQHGEDLFFAVELLC